MKLFLSLLRKVNFTYFRPFFTDPYSSWQKGAIENANKLLRQYIPKMANFDLISQKQIDEFCAKINARPREKLNFKSPAQVFFTLLP